MILIDVADNIRRISARSRLARIGLASISSASVSMAHLGLQVYSISHFSTRDVGILAFLLVFLQFGFSLSNALISTPYSVTANQPKNANLLLDHFFVANAFLCAGCGAICALVTFLLTSSSFDAAGFGIASGSSLLRWFGRSHAFANHRPAMAALSDIIYAAAVITGLACIISLRQDKLIYIGLIFVIANCLGLWPYGMQFLREHASRDLRSAFHSYGHVWKQQSLWTLIGVLSTEITSNAHSYVVTMMAGPTAYAPIAVGALFFRPVGVCLTALTQLERPQMTMAVSTNHIVEALKLQRRFLQASLSIWALTTLLTVALLLTVPQWFVKPGINIQTLTFVASLTSALSLIQCIQTPLSVFAQARGEFRRLSMQSVRSCGVAIVLVWLMTQMLGPVYSLIGIICSQAVMAVGILILNRRWRSELDLHSPEPARFPKWK